MNQLLLAAHAAEDFTAKTEREFHDVALELARKSGFKDLTALPDKPGLGIELNPDIVKANLAKGEKYWGNT